MTPVTPCSGKRLQPANLNCGGVLGGSCPSRRTPPFGFPCVAHFLALSEDIFFCLVEIRIHAGPLDHVAGAAARHQVAWILFALARSRHHEINGHDQRVLEAGLSVQSAVPAAELIAFQDLQAFCLTHRPVHQRQGHDVEWHRTPPNRKSSCMEGICDYLSADHTAAFVASQDRGVDRRTAPRTKAPRIVRRWRSCLKKSKRVLNKDTRRWFRLGFRALRYLLTSVSPAPRRGL